MQIHNTANRARKLRLHLLHKSFILLDIICLRMVSCWAANGLKPRYFNIKSLPLKVLQYLRRLPNLFCFHYTTPIFLIFVCSRVIIFQCGRDQKGCFGKDLSRLRQYSSVLTRRRWQPLKVTTRFLISCPISKPWLYSPRHIEETAMAKVHQLPMDQHTISQAQTHRMLKFPSMAPVAIIPLSNEYHEPYESLYSKLSTHLCW